MKTEAAVLFQLNQPLRLTTLDIPQLEPGQVLVKVVCSGICHSQLNEIMGLKGDDNYLPHTLGHEGSGIVLEIGKNVTKVRTGDHVVLSWIKGSGADVPATVYNAQNGQVNSGAISTLMNKTITSENRLIPIPKEMPLKEAALLGCAIPTGAGIILNEAKVKTGDSIAIFGIGGVGLSAVMAASVVGAKIIIAVDRFDHKLEQALEMGATHVINAKHEDSLAQIKNITHGRGVNYAIEAAGSIETMETAFKSIKYNGGLCVIAGNLPNKEVFTINPMDLIRGKKIIGTWGGATNPDKDISRYIDWYLSGKMRLDKLITHIYELDNVNQAFSELMDGKVGRALITLNGNTKLEGDNG